MPAKSPEFIYICDSQSNIKGSLSGLKLGVKDLFHVAGMPTTAGNPDWMASHPQPATNTAPSVTALLQEGATLIGKTLTDELAYSLEGINKHYGTPINPQAPKRLPGGSSSGSAVAVANGSIDIGLGTDTGGSIRVPASYNGLYGFRPTHGAISCQHLIPLAPSFDTVGWMTRDLNTMLGVADVLLPPANNHYSLSRLVICNTEGVDFWKKARQSLVTRISEQFDSIKEITIASEQITLASSSFRVLQGREIWQVHGDWLDRQQPDLATEISDRFKWCQTLTSDDERKARQAAREFIDFWQTNVLSKVEEVLLMPTTPGAAPLLNTPKSQLLPYRNHLLGMTALAGLTKAPQITLPYLSHEQAPWGVSLIALANSDRALLECADRLDKVWNCL